MRVLSSLLDGLSTGIASRRSPSFRVEIYDVRSSATTTISNIVAGDALDPIVGPLDVSAFCRQAQITEQISSYQGGSIVADFATLTFEDPDGLFDPFLLVADPTADGRWFRSGNVVRIYEGDSQAPENTWPNTQTMVIRGQAGYLRSRAAGQDGSSQLTVRALSREADFLGISVTSREYTFGETYLTIGTSLATEEMGLQTAEVDFSGWGSRTLRQSSMTLANEPALTLLARVMFADGFLPRFNGEGKLTQRLAFLSGGVQRVYQDKRVFVSIGWPQSDIKAADAVVVLGLDFNLARVNQPRQVVAEASVTTGYFTDNERIQIYFSEDRTLLCDEPVFIVKRSVNGGLASLGGGELATGIPAPNTTNEGFVGMEVTIDTGFAPWLSVFLLVTYIALSYVPDTGFGGGFGFVTIVTVSIGRAAQAIALSAAMIIMTSLGRGIYEIEAQPFEYVFPEIRRRAVVAGTPVFTTNEIEVQNHLIDDAATCEIVAREILFLEQATEHPRDVVMFHDLALEPGDVFTTLDDERSFLCTGVSRTLSRTGDPIQATVSAEEVTTGIEVAG